MSGDGDTRDQAAEVSVIIARIEGNDDLPLPAAATSGSAGLDLRAALGDAAILDPGQRLLIPTGFRMAIPPGYEGQIRPRSGLALRQGLTLLNSPGTIDSDYRGEIMVALINLGQDAVPVPRGTRIAQLVFQRVEGVELRLVDELPASERGDGGFGSTGA